MSGLGEEPEHHLAVDEVLRTPQADKTHLSHKRPLYRTAAKSPQKPEKPGRETDTFGLKFPSKEKKYNLLYFLIDKNRQAVKYFLNYREQLKTEEYKKIFNEKDISFVLELFREVGLSDIAKKVETDIIRLNF